MEAAAVEAAFPVDSPSTVPAAALENGGSDDEEEATASGELLLGRWRFLFMFVEAPPPPLTPAKDADEED